jgi:hypothetical protein
MNESVTVSVHGDVTVEQSLHNKVRHDTPVVRVHTRAISVEYPGDFDPQIVLSPIIEKQRLRTTLAFVITRAGADGADIAPIVFGFAGEQRDRHKSQRSKLGECMRSGAWQDRAY